MKKKQAKKRRNGELFLRAAEICADKDYNKGACAAFSNLGCKEAYGEDESSDTNVRFFAGFFKPYGVDCLRMKQHPYKQYNGWWGRKDPARVIGLLLAKAMWEDGVKS